MSTRALRKLSYDDFSADKCKDQAESHEDVAAEFAASKLFADQGSMIKQGATPKGSKMNPTYNTNKPQSFQTANSLEIAVKI